MIAVPIYLNPDATYLLRGYEDFRLEAAEHWGKGSDITYWTSDDILALDRMVNQAYHWCLYPQTIPGERVPHVWSFMEQTTTLATVADDYDYTLPSDFGSFTGNYFTWGSGSGYDPPFKVSDTDILMQRSQSTHTGRPQKFALRWRARSDGATQLQEVLFWPTPDAAYTLTYKYAVLAGKLGVNQPYPLGGPRMSQLMIEASRAIGELKKTGSRGDQWGVFMTELQSAIMLDKGTNTSPSVGIMGPNSSFSYGQSLGSENYYYGPYNNSPENGSALYSLTAQ